MIYRIFADRQETGEYAGTELIDNLEYTLSNLEKIDVENSEYQIWEAPSGKIFLLEWQLDGVAMRHVLTDARKVNDTLERLTTKSHTKPWWKFRG